MGSNLPLETRKNPTDYYQCPRVGNVFELMSLLCFRTLLSGRVAARFFPWRSPNIFVVVVLTKNALVEFEINKTPKTKPLSAKNRVHAVVGLLTVFF